MVNVLGTDIPISMPSFGLGSNIWFFVFLLLAVCLVGGIAIYFMFRFKVYRYKIVIFENISGQGYRPVGKDRARLVKVGDGGEEILYLMKRKVYRAAYGRKMGINTFWFAIGQDGYWYNIVLGDLDAKMGMLDIEPIDRDMRYMHVAIRRNIQDRYKKTNFMEKYGTVIMSGIFLVVMLIGMWFLLDKIAEISQGVSASVEASQKVSEASERIVGALENLKTIGGSGLVDAG